MKIQIKMGGGGSEGRVGGQGGYERRIEVFGRIHKNKSGGGREGSQVGGRVGGGQGGCERNVGGRGDVGYGYQE